MGLTGGGLTSHVASKTYLDLPSFYEPPEYSVVICADDDEYAGRAKLLQKVCLTFSLALSAGQQFPQSYFSTVYNTATPC